MIDRYNAPAPSDAVRKESDTRPGASDTSLLPMLEADLQIRGQLLRLVTQSEYVQTQLDRLLAEAQESGVQIATLTRHVTDPRANQATEERLAELVTRLETVQEQLQDLGKTVAKLGRTQFKSNTLTESREDQVAQALTTLQEIASRREQTTEAWALAQQRRLAQVRTEARGELAADILPGLDGLELALEHGRQLLDQQRRRQAAGQRVAAVLRREKPSSGVWRGLRRLFTNSTPSPTRVPTDPADEMADALDAWLQGLELVRERFLALLAQEGIQPIPALNRPFDPRLHVAVESETRRDAPPNTVIAVLRKGYMQGERVLRYAEVVVSRPKARSEDEKTPVAPPSNGGPRRIAAPTESVSQTTDFNNEVNDNR